MKEYLIKNYPKRDSLMASYIIKTFDSLSQYSSRKKALVIMNYRHAFSKSYTKDRNVGDYLFEKYKGKTANVYINYLASLNKFDERDKDKAKMFQGMEQVPIQNGKWDASFKLSEKENLGFNFENSPFGKDYFNELLERIREIRASERRVFQKLGDIFEQCSADYSKDAEETKLFYKMV